MSKKHRRAIGLVLLILLLLGCGISPGGSPSPIPTEVTPAMVSPLSPMPTATPVIGGGEGGESTPEAPPLCSQLNLEIEYHQAWSMPEVAGEFQAIGEIPLSVDTAAAPPTVRGEGELPISGQGHAGECTYTVTGALGYDLEGEIVSGTTGGMEVHLRGQRTANVAFVGGECGGGGIAPPEAMVEMVLPYEDGATVEWSQDMMGIQVSATWTLHVPCEP